MEERVKLEVLIKDKYSELSAAQKKAADYIFENFERAAFSTAIEISEGAGVSDSSVIRLSYSLGFTSFSQMQQMIKQQILTGKGITIGDEACAGEQLEQEAIAVAELEISAIKSMINNLSFPNIKRAAKLLIDADQILVMGYFSAFTTAYEFYINLSLMRPNVYFYRTSETEFQRLYNLTEKSVVVAVSFPKHPKDVHKFIREGKKHGASIISVTNSELSPVSRESDIPFTVEVNTDNETGIPLTAPALTLLYYIISEIKKQDNENSMGHLRNLRKNLNDQDIFFE